MFNRSPPLFLFYSGNLPKGAEGSPLFKKNHKSKTPLPYSGAKIRFFYEF